MEPLDAIREVLGGWDPYRQHDQRMDESIAGLLRRRIPVSGLAAYLGRMRVDRLGLTPNHIQDQAIARQLVALPSDPPSTELTAAERRLLRQGLMEWGGMTRGAEMVARMLGLPSAAALYDRAGDLAQRLDLDEPFDAADRETALLLTELCFLSEVSGVGAEWHALHGDDDASTLQVLRGLQAAMRTSPRRPRPPPPRRAAEALLRIHGGQLAPADVTRLLRLPPDHLHHTGEPRLALRPAGVVREGASYPTTMWALSTKGRVSSSEPATHVRWLLRLLEPRAAAVRTLAAAHHVDIFCYRPEAYVLEPDATQLAGMGVVLRLGGDTHR